MDKKVRKKRFEDQACIRYKQNMLKLTQVESLIQQSILEFTAETGINILDIQLYDPETGEIQFEINI